MGNDPLNLLLLLLPFAFNPQISSLITLLKSKVKRWVLLMKFLERLETLSQDKRVDLNSNPIIIDLLKLCNPYERLDNDNYHDVHIKMVRIMQKVKEGIPKDKLSCSFAFGAE